MRSGMTYLSKLNYDLRRTVLFGSRYCTFRQINTVQPHITYSKSHITCIHYIIPKYAVKVNFTAYFVIRMK